MLMNELAEKEYCSVEYPSPVGVVQIPKERNIYNSLRKKYFSLAEEAKNTFSEIYGNYQGCNDILNESSRDFQKSLVAVIDNIKKDLISLGRYDLDYDTIYQFANENGYLNTFYKVSDEICEKIMGVYEDLEAQKQYREARKENRSRWEGGMIGGNVIQNYSHQAGLATMNMAEGAAHSLFNAAGNAMSKMAANAELKKLFQNPNTRTSMENSVFETAFCLHYAVIELVGDCNREIIWGVPRKESITTSKRLLNNLKTGAVPADKIADIYQEILSLNPYNLELFEVMLQAYGDGNGELGALAEYYGVDLKHSKDLQALQYVKEIQGETEEDSVNAKEKLILYCNTISLPVTDDLECMTHINKRLEDFDLQYRTVDDVVCTTRDSADYAREELPQLQKFLEEIVPPTSESLLDYEADLLERRSVFEEQFHSELKEKYQEKINGYLSDFDKKFCSTGFLKRVDRKQAGKDRLLKMMKKADTSSLEKIEEAHNMMAEILPKLGLAPDETTEAEEYLAKQKDKILNPKSAMGAIKGLGKFFKK